MCEVIDVMERVRNVIPRKWMNAKERVYECDPHVGVDQCDEKVTGMWLYERVNECQGKGIGL